MFLVEIDVLMGTTEPLSDEEISSLIEALVDELDHLPVEPSVGSTRIGNDLEMTVGVVVDEPDAFAAMSFAAPLIRAAFHSAGVGTAAWMGAGDPESLRSRVSVLQPA